MVGNTHDFDPGPIDIFQYQVCTVSSNRLLDVTQMDFSQDKLPEGLKKMLAHPVIPKNLLKPLHKFNGRMKVPLAEFGCQTHLGWIVPRSKFDELLKVVKDVKKGVADARDSIIKELPAIRSELLKRVDAYQINADTKSLLSSSLNSAIPTKMYIKSQIKFWHVLYRVNAIDLLDTENDANLNVGYNNWCKGLFGDVVMEVSRHARKILHDLNRTPNRNEIASRYVDKFRCVMVNKIRGLQFVSNKVKPLADSLEDIASHFPVDGTLTGKMMSDYFKVMDCLSDNEYITNCIKNSVPLFKKLKYTDNDAIIQPSITFDDDADDDVLNVVSGPSSHKSASSLSF